MNFETKYNTEGVKIGPFPNDSSIIINPDGSLFLETLNNNEHEWKHEWKQLETHREWLKPSINGCVGKPTPKYRQIKYRRMMDFVIGYVDEKIVRMHTMFGEGEEGKGAIYISLALSDGSEVRYNKGKYSI